MNSTEKLINELMLSSDELYHKDRTQEQQIEIAKDMLKDVAKLAILLEQELEAVSGEDLY